MFVVHGLVAVFMCEAGTGGFDVFRADAHWTGIYLARQMVAIEGR